MKHSREISSSVISRLPRYYRFLCELYANGTTRISSKELAEIMGFTASQIRQDFNCFGGFGQQGYGYNIEQLIAEFAGILGLNELKTAILIGAGNLGRAVASQMSFEDKGFKLIGIFDCDPLFNGIKSFWNFSHYDILRKYPDLNVANVHLSDSLMTLSFIIKNNTGEEV